VQTDSRIFDSVARAFTNAAGAAQAFRAEIETMVKGRIERLVADMDLVTREDFDAVKAMAAKARSENEKLAARVAELESKLGIARKQATGASPRTAQPAKARKTKRGSAKL
jgi:BMFP domain-containing protein YqiC